MAARVRWGLVENAIQEEQLRRIADAAAGDARIALSILRSAARRADRTGDERIADEQIETAILRVVRKFARRASRRSFIINAFSTGLSRTTVKLSQVASTMCIESALTSRNPIGRCETT